MRWSRLRRYARTTCTVAAGISVTGGRSNDTPRYFFGMAFERPRARRSPTISPRQRQGGCFAGGGGGGGGGGGPPPGPPGGGGGPRGAAPGRPPPARGRRGRGGEGAAQGPPRLVGEPEEAGNLARKRHRGGPHPAV